MRRKGILFVLIILFIGCLSAGIIGYFLDKQGKNSNKPDDETPTIKYVYYLENVEVTKEEVTNDRSQVSETETEEDDFIFSSSSCTNGVTGDFDTDAWEFIPSETKESTCKLYFNKARYEVTLTITNGELASGTTTTVEREKNGIFTINPYEGYEFDTYTCSNNKEAAWDKVNNKLTINAVMEDVACKIVFKTRTLKMNLTVVNGTGTTTETVEYGKKITSVITPNSGFENPTVKCTNDQEAKYTNNTITIDKLTNDTDCTVTYAAVKVEEYTLTIAILPYSITIESGGWSQKVKKGETGQFTLKGRTIDNVTYVISSYSCYKSGTPAEIVSPAIGDNADGSKTYVFTGMTKNITCDFVAAPSS